MTDQYLKKFYFVDEAGDLTLFNKRGKIIVGGQGVSKFFMLGVADIPNPKNVHYALNKLRAELLADPYFKDVPSMRPEASKTAISFHASKDPPEVRREVFKLLPKFGAKVQVIIRRKTELANTAKFTYQTFGIKPPANQIYDDLVKRLFRNLLHKANENRIIVARRGKSARLKALHNAINRAKVNFEAKYGIRSDSTTIIQPAYPREFGGLQVIDYYLWALQCLYERGNDRYFNLLTSDFRLIMDIDDTRNKPYGEYYSDTNPLTAQKIKPAAG